jgi:hypothetical protein
MSRQQQKRFEQVEEVEIDFDQASYINNYMNLHILRPLHEIRLLLIQRDYDRALEAEWAFIASLPPHIGDLLKPQIEALKKFFQNRNSIVSIDIVQTRVKKQGFTVRQGMALSQSVYNVIWRTLHEHQMFEFLKGYAKPTAGDRRSGLESYEGLPGIMDSRVK